MIFYILRRREGQPYIVVRAHRTHAAGHIAGARGQVVPPVQGVALRELVRGRSDYMRARAQRVAVKRRKAVLELVAETVRAARLVKPVRA